MKRTDRDRPASTTARDVVELMNRVSLKLLDRVEEILDLPTMQGGAKAEELRDALRRARSGRRPPGPGVP